MRNRFLFRAMLCALLTVCIVTQTVPAIVFAEEPSTAVVSKLQVEYQENPIGLDTSAPRFSWIIEDTVRGQLQTAYQIRVATSKSGLATGPYVWDTGKVVSPEQNGIEYAGDALQPATVYYWNVTIWDKDGKVATSTQDAYWETGLMGSGWSGAKWIGSSVDAVAENETVLTPYFLQSDTAALGINDTAVPTNPMQNDDTVFTVDMDVKVHTAAAGFNLNMSDDNNTFLTIQVNTTGQTPVIKYIQTVNGAASVLNGTATTAFTNQEIMDDFAHIRMKVNNGEISLFLVREGEEVALPGWTVDPFPAGKIGFRQPGGETAEYDNILIKDSSGNVLYDEDFEAEPLPFTGGSRTPEGTLYVTGGIFAYHAQVTSDEYKFSAEYDVKVIQVTDSPYTAAGFLFDISEDRKSFRVIQINANAGNPNTLLRYFETTDGGTTLLNQQNVQLPGEYAQKENVIGQQIHISMEADNGQLKLYIGQEVEKQLIAEFSVTPFAPGTIGFRQGWNEEAEFDNIVIRDANGESLFDIDFSGQQNPFSGGVITADGTLKVGEGVYWYVGQSEGEDKYTFSVEYDVKVKRMNQYDGGGFALGMDENDQTFRLFQINANSTQPTVQLRYMETTDGGNTMSNRKNFDLPGKYADRANVVEQMIHITLEVDNGNIDAYVGEAGERLSIGSFYVTPFEVGLIGFRQGWGEEAEFDNIVVKDAAGDILYSEDFEKDRVNFSGGSITEDKTLLVSEGVFHYVNRAAQNTYTIESTLIPNQGGGIVFGAADENNLYWWQLDVGRLLLKPMRMVDGIWQQDFANGAQTDLSPYLTNEKLGQPIALRLEVVDDTVKTYIDETLVATTTITPALIGRVGIYHEAGYNALYDSLFVYDVEGKAVYAETFDDGAETIFSPAFVTVENSNLVWGEGLLLTATDRYREAAPMVRKEFSTKSGISSARLYATALGIYDFYMNGQKVTDTYFNPGNTAYPERVQYQTYDVTELIVEGSNAIGAFIGHGWYDRAAGIARKHKPWGDTLALQAKLVIQYTDGSTEAIVTDETWKYYGNGPIRDNDFYNGEVYDANREVPGWDRAGVDDAKWTPVATYTSEELNAGTITAKEDPHVKNIEILRPISVTEPVDNVFVYDFGQNFAGIVRLKVTGEQGQKIILQHGEEINAENLRNKDGETGTVWRMSNNEALATDEYVLKGDPDGEIFEPSFVFHGFRYMQILGLEEAIPIEDVEGLVLMTDLEETSSFESSDSAVNQLYSNALWSQRSNFIDIPTDCPQRAERLGYTGDAQIYARTASYYMNTLPFMEKFLRDVRDVQREDGAYSDMAPLCWDSNYGTNGWGGRRRHYPISALYAVWGYACNRRKL